MALKSAYSKLSRILGCEAAPTRIFHGAASAKRGGFRGCYPQKRSDSQQYLRSSPASSTSLELSSWFVNSNYCGGGHQDSATPRTSSGRVCLTLSASGNVFAGFPSRFGPFSSRDRFPGRFQNSHFSQLSSHGPPTAGLTIEVFRRFSSWTPARVSSPGRVLVVQPRIKPDWLLKSRLSEALRLVEALHTRNQERPLHYPPPPKAQRSTVFQPDWWPSGVPDTSPWVIAGQTTVRSRSSSQSPSPSALFGKGAVETVATHVLAADNSTDPIEAVFVNASLTGTQQRILEQAWEKKVIDRVGLIIDIFGARAATKEAKLQVELAFLAYQRSRLVRVRASDARGRGGFGPQESFEVVSARAKGSGGRGFLAGAGESELQLQRTRLVQKQQRLKRMLEEVRRTRELHRARRRRSCVKWGGREVGLPVVAVVGYTNAGKSTLVSALSGSSQFCDDSLFATLDPKIRGVKLPSGRKALLSDTVGFISDLPIELIDAFQATLEEVVEADLLLHVIDGSTNDGPSQREAVLQVLRALGIGSAKGRSERNGEQVSLQVIEAWNKADLWRERSGGLEQEDAEKAQASHRGEDVPEHHVDQQREELKILPPTNQPGQGYSEHVLRVNTSAVTGQGLEELLNCIDHALWQRGY